MLGRVTCAPSETSQSERRTGSSMKGGLFVPMLEISDSAGNLPVVPAISLRMPTRVDVPPRLGGEGLEAEDRRGLVVERVVVEQVPAPAYLPDVGDAHALQEQLHLRVPAVDQVHHP